MYFFIHVHFVRVVCVNMIHALHIDFTVHAFVIYPSIFEFCFSSKETISSIYYELCS